MTLGWPDGGSCFGRGGDGSSGSGSMGGGGCVGEGRLRMGAAEGAEDGSGRR